MIAGYPKEKQAWLKRGGKLTTTMEELGTLRFTLARAAARKTRAPIGKIASDVRRADLSPRTQG